MKKIYAVYNGSFNYLEDIKISPLSRAYTFSDSVYEVIPFFNFKAIAYKKHIHRLQNSCNALGISINIEAISSEITSLIKNSCLENGYIYYQISRGIDALRSHMYDDSILIPRHSRFHYVKILDGKDVILSLLLCLEMY